MISFVLFSLLCISSIEAKLTGKRINSELTHKKLWSEYKQNFNLKFSDDEENDRREIFVRNHKFIQHFNANNNHMKLGVNKFAHLTDEEYHRFYLSKNFTVIPGTYTPGSSPVTPVDWRKKNAVNPIKDQGACGSCWAFSAIAAIEGAYALKKDELLSFSEQDLVDCSTAYGNHGCGGGLMDNAFEYVMNKGITLENEYPYTARDQRCKTNRNVVSHVSEFVDIAAGNEDQLTNAIMFHGPVSVAIFASLPSFRFYKSGIYYDPQCTDQMLNHGITAVGVTKDYYIVRNSWGESWGDAGYIKMARNKGNLCGIASVASFPRV